jgi:hypothetical protein
MARMRGRWLRRRRAPGAGTTAPGDARSRVQQAAAGDPRLAAVPDLLAAVPSTLREGEDLVDLAAGACGGRAGLVVLTDRRLVFLARDPPGRVLVDLPYSRLGVAASEVLRVTGRLTLTSVHGAVVLDLPAEAAARVEPYLRLRTGGLR